MSTVCRGWAQRDVRADTCICDLPRRYRHLRILLRSPSPRDALEFAGLTTTWMPLEHVTGDDGETVYIDRSLPRTASRHAPGTTPGGTAPTAPGGPGRKL